MLSTLLVVGVISHLWCAARLVGISHHSFYSVDVEQVPTPAMKCILSCKTLGPASHGIYGIYIFLHGIVDVVSLLLLLHTQFC